MRPVSEWEELDILALIESGTQESNALDYKACDALRATSDHSIDRVKAEVSKDVSGIANAAGGLLVYGIKEAHHVPVELSEGVDPRQTTREWLEQVIQSNIKPTPQGVFIKPVLLTTQRPGRVAYVVEVPMSPNGWQASDKRYYRRRNFRNEPLEDYEIRELMHRAIRPVVKLEFGQLVLARPPGDEWRFELTARLVNAGSMRISAWKVLIDFPAVFLVENRRSYGDFDLGEMTEGGIDYRRFVVRNKSGEPLFPKDHFELFGIVDLGGLTGQQPRPAIEFRATERLTMEAQGDARLAVRWTIYADDMEPKQGVTYMRDLIRGQVTRRFTSG